MQLPLLPISWRSLKLRKKHVSLTLSVSIFLGLSVTAQSSTTIDIDGATNEFSDYSALSSGATWTASSQTDGELTLSVLNDGGRLWNTSWSSGSYVVGAEINSNQGAPYGGDATTAIDNGKFITLHLDSSNNSFDLESIQVTLWRNGAGASQYYQFAFDDEGDGFDVGDLLGTSTNVSGTGGSNVATISYNGSGLPVYVTSSDIRLYFWGGTSNTGNTHYVKFEESVSINIPAPQDIDIDGALLEFADYSSLSSGAIWGTSSVTEGSVTLSVKNDSARKWKADASYVTGAKIEMDQGLTSYDLASDAAEAISQDKFITLLFEAPGFSIGLGSVSADLWRNGAGAAQYYQFAYDDEGDGFDTGDLLGAPADASGTGSGNVSTVLYNGSSLPTQVAAASIRLYYWGGTSGTGPMHFLKFAGNVTVLPPLPEIVDTDLDGLSDSWEQQYFGSLDYNGWDDPDYDGVSNADEYAANTNPNLSASTAPPELHTLWNAVEALATDTTNTGRISTLPLVDWQLAMDTTGSVAFQDFSGNPKTTAGGTPSQPLIYRDVDFHDRQLWLIHSNIIFENCTFDASRNNSDNPPYAWIRFGENISNLTFVNCNFYGRKGRDNLNGGIFPEGDTDPTNYPSNFMRANNVTIESCRFKWNTGDYIKPTFGPGTVFRHNHFGYGWMFDSDMIPWTSQTGGLGILTNQLVLYDRALSRAKVDYPTTTPPATKDDPDTVEWENLGDKTHFDYLQGGGGGPVLWEANMFEVGNQDIPQLQQITNIVRFARDYGTGGAIAGHAFVGNVFRLRENYAGPLFPFVINHKATANQTLEDVNVLGHMEFSYNLMITKKNYPSVMQLAGKAEENLIFADNYLYSGRTFITPPSLSIPTTSRPIPTPPAAVAESRPPVIYYNTWLLSKDNGDGTISYRSLAPIYEGRSQVTLSATLNGVPIPDYDDSVLHTYPDTDELEVTYTLANEAGIEKSIAGGNRSLHHIDTTGAARFTVTDRVWPTEDGAADVCLWKDDKLGAVSITIDDNQGGQQPWWIQQGQTYGVPFTWFIITNWVGNQGVLGGVWSDYQALLNLGHDVQSHTVSHLSDHSLTIDQEYADSQIAIETNLIGHKVTTLAYPNGSGPPNDTDIAGEYYIAGRGTAGITNKPATLNFRDVRSYSSTFSLVALDKILNPASPDFRGWYVMHYHNLNDTTKVSIIDGLNYLQAKESDFWVGGFSSVALYAQERETAEVFSSMLDENRIWIGLYDRMDDAIFDYPLTVKVKLPDTWTAITAEQSGIPINAPIIQHNGFHYALVEVIPDAGQVILHKQ